MNTPRKLFLLSLGFIAAGVYGWMSRSPFENGIWRINFAPAGSPKVASFVNVGGDADYHSGKGYGWLNVDGELQAGRWPGDTAASGPGGVLSAACGGGGHGGYALYIFETQVQRDTAVEQNEDLRPVEPYCI